MARKWLFIPLLLIAVTLALYWPVTDHQFISYDDDTYVTNNPLVTGGLARNGVIEAFTTTREANWHPLTWLSHMADYQLYGLKAAGHHLTSLLIHILNTLLLFWLLRNMTGFLGRSAAVAALFALHPLHVESVAWVAERKDVLSAMLWMLALIVYSSYAARPATGKYLMVLCLFALGLMAKPMVVTLPIVLLLLDYWPLERYRRATAIQLLKEKVPFFLLSVVSCMITVFAQRSAGAMASTNDLPLQARLTNATISYLTYLQKTVWPHHLAVFYPFRQEQPWWLVLGAVFLLVSICCFCIRRRRTYPWFFVGWFWFVCTMVPVIGIVQVGLQGMADRYTYLPLVGLFIIFAWGLPAVMPMWRHRALLLSATALCTLLALTIISRRQLSYWKDSITLFSHAIAVTDDNFMMHHNLADALNRLGRYDEAVIHLRETLRVRPNMAEAHYLLGTVLYKQGKPNEAESALRLALRIRPDYGYAHNNLGVVLAGEGRDEEAVAEYAEALRTNPNDMEARQNLRDALQRLGLRSRSRVEPKKRSQY